MLFYFCNDSLNISLQIFDVIKKLLLHESNEGSNFTRIAVRFSFSA
jgi:hypothetical protein